MMSSLLQRLLTLRKTLETFLGIIIEKQEVRTLLKIRNFRKNDPIKVNNNEKPREKVGQSSNNSISPQCFGCQGYGHMKSKCPTYLKSKGKAMAVILSDGEVFVNKPECDEDGNFIAFIATAVVNKGISTEENASDGELFEDADLQEAYNKFCKVAAKDAINVELGLKKIESLELDKKNLLVKLFDANELLNHVKTENILLLDKVKSLELDLSVARSASSKLNQLLSAQKSPSKKSRLGFVESISVSAPYSTNFVPSSSSEPFVSEVVSETVKPPVSEVVKLLEVSPSRRIRVDLK